MQVIRASYVAVAHIVAFPDKPLPKELESLEPVEVDQTETEDLEETMADYPQKEHCVELLRVTFQQLLDHSVPVKQTCKTVKELQDCFDLWKKIGQVASSEVNTIDYPSSVDFDDSTQITCYTRRSEHSVQLFRRFIDAGTPFHMQRATNYSNCRFQKTLKPCCRACPEGSSSTSRPRMTRSPRLTNG